MRLLLLPVVTNAYVVSVTGHGSLADNMFQYLSLMGIKTIQPNITACFYNETFLKTVFDVPQRDKNCFLPKNNYTEEKPWKFDAGLHHITADINLGHSFLRNTKYFYHLQSKYKMRKYFKWRDWVKERANRYIQSHGWLSNGIDWICAIEERIHYPETGQFYVRALAKLKEVNSWGQQVLFTDTPYWFMNQTNDIMKVVDFQWTHIVTDFDEAVRMFMIATKCYLCIITNTPEGIIGCYLNVGEKWDLGDVAYSRKNKMAMKVNANYFPGFWTAV